jgi:hypothetical protein
VPPLLQPPPPPPLVPLPPSSPFRPEIFKPPGGGTDENIAGEGWNFTAPSNKTALIAVAA